MANAADLAGLILFLASDASAYITATNIPLDGGYTAKVSRKKGKTECPRRGAVPGLW
jgi:hypothetical protein